MEEETLEQIQARHRKEQRDLQSRVTSKKKNATKKTRKGVNDECAELERQLKERQESELRKLEPGGEEEPPVEEDAGDVATDEPAASSVDDLTSQLSGTGISEGSLAALQQGKKRNRQKDRLARRAAEREAEAEAAASEAAGMTDWRGAERTAMDAAFAERGLVEKEILPDGHCMFAAVADQLDQAGVAISGAAGEPPYKTIRRAAAGYMEAHADNFDGFLEEPLAEHVARIRDTAEWGGQPELVALANAYGLDICVIQEGRTEVVQPLGDDTPTADRKKIWLAYYRHGYGLGEHYNSLRKAPTIAT
jgi:OTU domain-containing protein 6